ncbi:hypothetical protein [Hymenobacter sp.]|uniref:hypothetical protein n=1 Tax=Hymenobacter sp. TaxID=1898978 RepID=UPI00286C89DB|nr:hypothetical protein [Hymenobacter sp.]
MLQLLPPLRYGVALILLSVPAWAQQPGTAPVLGAPPQPEPAAQTATRPSSGTGEVIGLSYTVELVSGTSFTGKLTAIGGDDLTFETKDLGLITVKRPNIKQLTLLTAEQASRGFDYIGNGNRLSFAPTARNLRRGEGTVQSIYVFLLGVNYGITDNISMGALFTWLPGEGSDNFFALTPKVSFPVSGDKLHIGAGALIVFQDGTAFTLTYGNTTYGSADNNVTAGVGYAFAGGEYISTPVFLLGGATRVSRRISLLNETYILNITDDGDRATLVGGIAGLRISGQRMSGSLGLMYGFYNYSNKRFNGSTDSDSDGGALPFAEVTYRFGRTK